MTFILFGATKVNTHYYNNLYRGGKVMVTHGYIICRNRLKGKVRVTRGLNRGGWRSVSANRLMGMAVLRQPPRLMIKNKKNINAHRRAHFRAHW